MEAVSCPSFRASVWPLQAISRSCPITMFDGDDHSHGESLISCDVVAIDDLSSEEVANSVYSPTVINNPAGKTHQRDTKHDTPQKGHATKRQTETDRDVQGDHNHLCLYFSVEV